MAKRRKKRKKQHTGRNLVALLLALCAAVVVLWKQDNLPVPQVVTDKAEETLAEWKSGLADLLETLPLEAGLSAGQGVQSATWDTLPDYESSPYVILDDNQPTFTEEERTAATSYETYAELDLLGRCGVAEACIGQDLMPTEERGEIGMVKPTGWYTVRYDGLVEGNYLYNRCHLIGYQLTGENANEQNLITGTRYLNVDGMLPFENQVADYVQETGNHVLYRVTPVFEGLELVARGVQMEAWSVEDGGEGVCFNVYCYNVQPGVEIDYLTGESQLAEEAA